MEDVNQVVEGRASPNGDENKRMAWVSSNNANENHAFGYNAYKDHTSGSQNMAFGYKTLAKIMSML